MSSKSAILGLTDLAGLLRDEGLPVVSEGTVVSTAAAVRDDLSASDPSIDRAIVLDTGEPFLGKWVAAAAPRLRSVVVLHGEHRTVTDERVHHLTLPVRADHVLRTAGIDGPAQAAGWTIEPTGQTATGEDRDPSTKDSVDDWGIPPVTEEPARPDSNDPTTQEQAPEAGDDTPNSAADGDPAAADWIQAGDAEPPVPASSPGSLYSPVAARKQARLAAQATESTNVEQVAPEDLFGVSAPGGVLRPSINGCPVVFSVAKKGGPGKTTGAIGLAERAASRGLKVTLVDMNRGQADIMIVLKLTQRGQPIVPTIFDAVMGDPAAAIIDHTTINEARSRALPAIGYRVVLGPPPQLADPDVVTDGIYRSVIEQARKDSDLVIVDTQMLEASDTSHLFDRIVIPYLAAGNWSLLVSELAATSTTNSQRGYLQILENDVSAANLLSYVNRVPAARVDSEEMKKVPQFFGQFSTYLGHVVSDDSIAINMDQGRTNALPDSLNTIFDDVLYRVTGIERPDPPTPQSSKKTSLLARLPFFGGAR